MSTKTTFKRIALVTVAALGFGVLSVVPSQASVSGLTITAVNGTATTLNSDSSTAASLNIQWLALAGTADSITVTIVPSAALPTGAVIGGKGFFWTESTTSLTSTSTSFPLIDTAAANAAVAGPVVLRAAIYNESYFRVKSPADSSANGTFSAKVKYSLGETTTSTIVAGTYSFNAVISSVQAGSQTTQVVPFNIVVTAPAAVVVVPAAGSAKAYIQAGTGPTFTGVLTDSATTGSLVAGTVIGQIQVSNFSSADVAANDTITVSMTGKGYLTTIAPSTVVTGREFIIANEDVLLMSVIADGSSGVGTITIKTVAGASFVKTVTFFDTKPTAAVATAAKKFIKAGTGSVEDVFSVVVTDVAGNAVTNATVTAAPTDTATTVGGAATCGTYDTTDSVYYCAVKGLSTTKFGPVAYTITATGADTAKTKVTSSATVTFADNVATKATLTGAATALPGASVTYTLTLTEKNGYAVADQTYGVNSEGGVLFATSVVSGWSTAPFATTDSFTSVSGVITSKGIMPVAGTGTGTWTLVGDGLQTLAVNAIDKTIGKTTLVVTTDVSNPAVDASTAAAEEATAAANDATDAALSAAEAAEAATAMAQEAVDAVAELSAQVTSLISALRAQITSLTNLVIKIQKKVKA